MKPLLIALGWLAFAGSLAGAPAAGPTRHRFLDHEFVREAQCAALVVNPPKSSEIVIRADKPWEQFMITFYLSVIDDGGKIRMWYVYRDKEKKGSLAYAESADGVNWVKPDLGVVDYHGSRAHNLLGVRNLEGTVFRDEHAANPQERYVYVSSVGKGGGIFRFTSPEGYTWKRDKAPLLPFEADSQKVTFWDSRLGKYVAYLRGWNLAKQPVGANRKVVRFEPSASTIPAGSFLRAHATSRGQQTRLAIRSCLTNCPTLWSAINRIRRTRTFIRMPSSPNHSIRAGMSAFRPSSAICSTRRTTTATAGPRSSSSAAATGRSGSATTASRT